MNAFDKPAGAAVFAPQRDLVAGHHPFPAEDGDVVVAVRRILIELPGGALHQLLTSGKAEDPGHGLVAIEDAAIDGGAINAGEIALEEEAMLLFAAAQRGLGPMTLHGVDEDLSADAEQRHRLVTPRARNGGSHAQRAEKSAVVDHRSRPSHIAVR